MLLRCTECGALISDNGISKHDLFHRSVEIEQLRESTREAHGVLKDLRTATVAAKNLVHELTNAVVTEQLEAAVEAGLEEYKTTLATAIDSATKAIFDRFDKIAKLLMGEDKQSVRAGKPSIPELAERMKRESPSVP